MSMRGTKSALATVGVELLDRGTLHTRCETCKHQWRIRQGADDRRPDYWWKCVRCYPEIRRRHCRQRLKFNAPFEQLRNAEKVA